MNFRLDDTIAVLERTPAVFRSLLAGLPETWIRSDEGPETFSPYDNLGHLIHCEHTDWIPRVRIILAQQSSRPFDPVNRFAHLEESKGKTLDELLDEFEQIRRENLEILRGWNLTEREFVLEGVHPELGRVNLRQLLSSWMAHDLGHIAQTARVMARQYRKDVGPWRTYLPVLDRGPLMPE